jgi:hypothetical protein
MNRILFIFASFLIFFVQGCSSESSPQNFAPKNGGFSVAFSQAPKEMSYPDVATAKNIKSFFVEEKNISFFVNYRTMNKDFLQNNTEQEILERLKDMGGNANKAKVIYERSFQLHGRLAKDVIYSSQDGGQQRVYLVFHKGRLFSIIVSAHGVDLKSDKQVLNFLNSFRFVDFDDGWW